MAKISFTLQIKNMGAETKTKGVQITFVVAESLRKKFNRHCKKLNVSAAQRLRDLIQFDLKK